MKKMLYEVPLMTISSAKTECGFAGSATIQTNGDEAVLTMTNTDNQNSQQYNVTGWGTF